MPEAIVVHRVPWSTNVERIALAAAHKGIPVRWVDHDPADRSELRRRTGQELVPVLEEPDGRFVVDSPVILAHLEARVPDPPLWPADPAERAVCDVFVDWFNRVWKVAPNALAAAGAAEVAGRAREDAASAALAAELRGSRDRFEALLTAHDHLLSPGFGIADVVAFPFLRYGAGIDPADPDPFHHVLHRELDLSGGTYPRLAAWIARVDARPRA